MTTLTAPYIPVLLAGLMGNVFVQVFHEPVTKHPLFVKDYEKVFTALPTFFTVVFINGFHAVC